MMRCVCMGRRFECDFCLLSCPCALYPSIPPVGLSLTPPPQCALEPLPSCTVRPVNKPLLCFRIQTPAWRVPWCSRVSSPPAPALCLPQCTALWIYLSLNCGSAAYCSNQWTSPLLARGEWRVLKAVWYNDRYHTEVWSSDPVYHGLMMLSVTACIKLLMGRDWSMLRVKSTALFGTHTENKIPVRPGNMFRFWINSYCRLMCIIITTSVLVSGNSPIPGLFTCAVTLISDTSWYSKPLS